MGPVESTAAGRAAPVVAAARWLDVTPAVAAAGGSAMSVAQGFAQCAMTLLGSVAVDTAELTDALKALCTAKDGAVRAALAGNGR
jgi:hypothetical protein